MSVILQQGIIHSFKPRTMKVNNPINSIEQGNHSKIESLHIPSRFSFFKRPIKNTMPSKEMTLEEVYTLIKGDQYKTQTAALRDLSSQKEAREYKEKHLDYICPSGTFSSRKNEGLIQHSGLMVIDFDHISGVADLKKTLLEDQYFDTELLFVSPSGMGVKWIISIDLDG